MILLLTSSILFSLWTLRTPTEPNSPSNLCTVALSKRSKVKLSASERILTHFGPQLFLLNHLPATENAFVLKTVFTATSTTGFAKCYEKLPHVAPPGHPARTHLDRPAICQSRTLIATESSTYTDRTSQFSVRLSAKPSLRQFHSSTFSLSASPACLWIINSGCTSHVTHGRAVFTSHQSFKSQAALDFEAGLPA